MTLFFAKGITLFLLGPFLGMLCASTIPHYQISSIDEHTVKFTNEAILQVHYKNWSMLREWRVGDIVELVSDMITPFVVSTVQTINGNFIIAPAFLIKNATHNNEQVTVWLQNPPIFPNLETFSITSINHNQRIIVLNDSTSWIYPEDDVSKAATWQINDIVMIGVNNFFFSDPGFDAILLNTYQQSLIKAIQP